MFYSYSAGSQYSNLSPHGSRRMPAHGGAHVCDVYPPKIRVPSAPALLTCGVEDSARLTISRIFLYRYREYGVKLIWEIYPGGHELTRQVLALPQTWFDDLLPNKDICSHVEYDTGIIQKELL